MNFKTASKIIDIMSIKSDEEFLTSLKLIYSKQMGPFDLYNLNKRVFIRAIK